MVVLKLGSASLRESGSGVFMSIKLIDGRRRTIEAFGKAVRSSRSRYLGTVRPNQLLGMEVHTLARTQEPVCEISTCGTRLEHTRTLSVSQSSLMLSTSVRITMPHQPDPDVRAEHE